MKHAEMLLKYNTYLLLNVEIKLESSEGYKAFSYFLETVGKLPEGFYNQLICTITLDTIDDYNQAVNLYLEKGGSIEKLIILEKDELEVEA
jgi:hypothetical protein